MPVFQSLATKPVIPYNLSAKLPLTLFTKQVVVKVTALVYDNVLAETAFNRRIRLKHSRVWNHVAIF